MTVTSIVEVAVAVLFIVVGALAYRRGGNQGAVLLFVVATLLLIHGLGLMEYRPSAAELGQ
jgi:hypothetical protein